MNLTISDLIALKNLIESKMKELENAPDARKVFSDELHPRTVKWKVLNKTKRVVDSLLGMELSDRFDEEVVNALIN